MEKLSNLTKCVHRYNQCAKVELVAVAQVLCASYIQLSVFALLTALISGVSPGHPTPPHNSNPVSQI